MTTLRLWCLALAASFALGCLPPPTVPVTPANTAQVSGCQTTTGTHNALVVSGFVLGGGTTALGAITALESGTNATKPLAITTAILGAAMTIDSTWAGFEAAAFASGHCSDVVGPLPIAAKHDAAGLRTSTPPESL
jgi:hypothetical protein